MDRVGSFLVIEPSLYEEVENATMNRSAVAGFGPSTEIGVKMEEGFHDVGIVSVIDIGADLSAFVLRKRVYRVSLIENRVRKCSAIEILVLDVQRF